MTLSDVVSQIAFAFQSTESRLDQEYSHMLPTQTQHPAIDSIREMCLIGFVWKIPFTAPQFKYTNSSIRIKFHTFWAQIALILTGLWFYLLLLLLLCCLRSPYSLRSSLIWFIKQSKEGDSKRRHLTNRFHFPKYRIVIRPAVFPRSLSPLSVTREKTCSLEVVSSRSCNASHTTD